MSLKYFFYLCNKNFTIIIRRFFYLGGLRQPSVNEGPIPNLNEGQDIKRSALVQRQNE